MKNRISILMTSILFLGAFNFALAWKFFGTESNYVGSMVLDNGCIGHFYQDTTYIFGIGFPGLAYMSSQDCPSDELDEGIFEN